MRLGLAAKLCLLAAVLVLAASGASYLFFKDARAAVREHELADLADAIDDHGKLLWADLERMQTDLLRLAASPAVRKLLSPGEADEQRAAAIRLAEQLCNQRREYQQIDFLRTDAANAVAAQFARTAAEPNPAGGPGRDAFSLVRRLSPEEIAFAKSAGPRHTELFAGIRVGSAGNGQPDGVILVRLDLAVLCERLNQSARVLAFLLNDSLEYLAHPLPERVRTPAAGDGDAIDRRLTQIAGDVATNNSLSDTIRTGDLNLPELA